MLGKRNVLQARNAHIGLVEVYYLCKHSCANYLGLLWRVLITVSTKPPPAKKKTTKQQTCVNYVDILAWNKSNWKGKTNTGTNGGEFGDMLWAESTVARKFFRYFLSVDHSWWSRWTRTVRPKSDQMQIFLPWCTQTRKVPAPPPQLQWVSTLVLTHFAA